MNYDLCYNVIIINNNIVILLPIGIMYIYIYIGNIKNVRLLNVYFF